NLIVHGFFPISMPAALFISLAATLGPAMAAWGLRRLEVDLGLSSVRDVLRFAAVASVLVVATVPSVGVAVLSIVRSLSWQDAGDLWLQWAMADCLSVLAVTPLLLWLFNPASKERQRTHRVPFPLSIGFLALVTALCYSLSPPVGYPIQ